MAKTGGGLRNTRPANSTGSNQVTESDYNLAAEDENYRGKDLQGGNDYNNRTINAYTDFGYLINNRIAKGNILSYSDKQYINNLNKALDSLPNENPDTILWRGNAMPFERTNKYVEGNIIQLNTFFSTTEREDMATNWSATTDSKKIQVLYKIISHKTAKNISLNSQYPTEKERLFKIGTKFKVVKKALIGNNQLIIELKEV